MPERRSNEGAEDLVGATRRDRWVSWWMTHFRARQRRRAYPEYAEHDANRPTSYPSERHFAGIAAELVTRRD